MNKRSLILIVLLMCLGGVASSQSIWWVFFTDKQGSSFDPYTYFDPHAIERYQRSGADLYDVSNYPVCDVYVEAVAALATEVEGASRWLNAVGVEATPDQAAAIAALPCVRRVQPVEGHAMLASVEAAADTALALGDTSVLTSQLLRMQGSAFVQRGIDGSGVRIAVFDGGFPRVDKHKAFQHLREAKRIVTTWNFPNRRENVYGWNSHGTMTLSCITGLVGGKQLGLATGAEFLLARTEVASEPFKEEVWWQMAMEWADKNGADIISSSLGYGKERHYTTDMDGTSYVARAANMAARKGILVCNSAGNEADSRQWKTIITPADADSVLCVGGIEASPTHYNHIYFSSFGPSADGRLKPNVCAFGKALTAKPSSDSATNDVYGTSFSCPLVAGFAACAWQTRREATAMELFHLIEQSADLYPYADYTYGYGVPQASFFLGTQSPANPTFRFVEANGHVSLQPLRLLTSVSVFFKEKRPDGTIARYGKRTFPVIDSLTTLDFSISQGNSLVAHLAGYTDSILPTVATATESKWPTIVSREGALYGGTIGREHHTLASLRPSRWGSNAQWRVDGFVMFGLPATTVPDQLSMLVWSPAGRLGVRVMRAFGKAYCLGMGLEWGRTAYNYKGMQVNALEQSLAIPTTLATMQQVSHRRARLGEVSLEAFQRVRLRALGLLGKGLHWDLGIYASYGYSSYSLKGQLASTAMASTSTLEYSDLKVLNAYRWNYGLTTRFTYDIFGLYARYRLGSLATKPNVPQEALPGLEIGLQLMF